MSLAVLDLFSGIGGFSLGLDRAGMHTIAFCERDPYCQKVLAKHWPDIPIHDDIRTLDGEQYRGSVDLVCGGFPCQPFSLAGKQRGKGDDRDLWPEMLRVIRECRPAWVIGENVAGFVSMELDRTLADLEGEGFACRTFDIPACGVGALHVRHRVWIVANASSRRLSEPKGRQVEQPRGAKAERSGNAPDTNRLSLREQSKPKPRRQGESKPRHDGAPRPLADAHSTRQLQQERGQPRERGRIGDSDCKNQPYAWPAEPDVGRVAHGVPNRVDRIRALGNAVVPQIPEIIGRAILATHQPHSPQAEGVAV